MAAAVLNDIVDGPEESRVAVKIDFTIFGLVPFGIQYCEEVSVSYLLPSRFQTILTQIFGVQEFLNLARMVLGSVWYRECMVARKFIGIHPLSHLVFPFGLDVS
jgi:hypothetical protein